MIQTLAFYFFSAVCLALFGISVFSKNVLYALSALAGGMVFMSGFFLFAGCGVFGRSADHSLHWRRDRALRLRADVFGRG